MVVCAFAVAFGATAFAEEEDNVARFPQEDDVTPVTFSDPEPVFVPDVAMAPADASYPMPPPMPTISPNMPANPYDSSTIYGWPGSEEEFSQGRRVHELGRHAGHSILPASFGMRTDPDDPARHIGMGEPLYGTSWRNRPYYSALLIGSMIADDLRGNVELHNDLFVGIHQGWDFDHYYGTECRIAGGSYDVYDSPNGATDDIAFADAHLLYYPWGDSLWRPYYSIGLGLAFHHARINNTQVYDETLVHIPLGIGLKYQWQRHCAMRFDIKHNISFSGGGLHGMDHVSLSYGFEYRYGGRPKSYFPWSPSIHLK